MLTAPLVALSIIGLTQTPINPQVPVGMQRRLQLLDSHLQILSLRSHSQSYVSGIGNIAIGVLFGALATQIPDTSAGSATMRLFFWTIAITSVLQGVVEVVFVPDNSGAYERFAELTAEDDEEARDKIHTGRTGLSGVASTALIRRLLSGGIAIGAGVAVPIAFLGTVGESALADPSTQIFAWIILISGALQAVQGVVTLLTRSPEEMRWDLYRRQARNLRRLDPTIGAAPIPGGALFTLSAAF